MITYTHCIILTWSQDGSTHTTQEAGAQHEPIRVYHASRLPDTIKRTQTRKKQKLWKQGIG